MTLHDDLSELAAEHPMAKTHRRHATEPASYGDIYKVVALMRLVDWSKTVPKTEVTQLLERLLVLGDALDQVLTHEHTAAVAAYVAGRDAA